MRPRVFFYVQHLLGIGHVVRSMRLARTLSESEFDVTLALGGPPIAGLDAGRARVIALPAIRAGAAGFTDLIDAKGRPLDETGKAVRRDALLAAFDAASPDILLIEAFPFGRRQMRFELIPLLEHAWARRPRPLVASSVRDILQQERRAGRAEEYADLVELYFDVVLVHGDPQLARFGDSFTLADRIAPRLRYTGLVSAGIPGRAMADHDVIVSAGGGAVGEDLIRAALAARPATSFGDMHWLVVTGPNVSPNLAEDLCNQRDRLLTVARFLPDLPQRLAGARLSISQAGYNTVVDLLAARCRSVLIPYAAAGETEQTQRARLLQARGLVIVSEAEPRALAAAMEAAVAQPPIALDISLNGAARSASLLAEALSAARSA